MPPSTPETNASTASDESKTKKVQIIDLAKERTKRNSSKSKDSKAEKSSNTLPSKITQSTEYNEGLSKKIANEMMGRFQERFKGQASKSLPIEKYRQWEEDARKAIKADYDAEIAKAQGIALEIPQVIEPIELISTPESRVRSKWETVVDGVKKHPVLVGFGAATAVGFLEVANQTILNGAINSEALKIFADAVSTGAIATVGVEKGNSPKAQAIRAVIYGLGGLTGSIAADFDAQYFLSHMSNLDPQLSTFASLAFGFIDELIVSAVKGYENRAVFARGASKIIGLGGRLLDRASAIKKFITSPSELPGPRRAMAYVYANTDQYNQR